MATGQRSSFSAGRRVGAQLVALLNLAGAGIVAFFGLIADGLRCDDNCSIAPGWRNDPNAWQWHASLVLALVVFGSSLVLNAAVLIRRARHLGSAAVGVQLATLGVLAAISFTADARHDGFGFFVLPFIFLGATGAGSVLSAPR